MSYVVQIRSTEDALAHAKSSAAIPTIEELLPRVKLHSREGAIRWGRAWMREAQHQEERAMINELLLDAYRLQLAVAEREIERLRGLL